MTAKELKEKLHTLDDNAEVCIQILDFGGEGGFPIDSVKIDLWEDEEGNRNEQVVLLQTSLYDPE